MRKYWRNQSKLNDFIDTLIISTLESFNWNRAKTAKDLGVSIRWLRIKIAKYVQLGMIPPKQIEIRQKYVEASKFRQRHKTTGCYEE